MNSVENANTFLDVATTQFYGYHQRININEMMFVYLDFVLNFKSSSGILTLILCLKRGHEFNYSPSVLLFSIYRRKILSDENELSV